VSISETKPELVGIGGWLILPIIGFVAAPVYQTYKFASLDWQSLWSIWGMDKAILSGFRLPLSIWLLGEVLTVLLALFCLWCVARKSYIMLFGALSFYSVVILTTAADAWFGDALNRAFPGTMDDTNLLASVVAAVIKGAIWIAYFVQSERVENTFVN
jgi:Protein of unknown function (DUF2569)